MSSTRTILVTSASGNIGTELVPLLAKEPNTTLILPTRNADRLRSSVPTAASQNAKIEEGDVTDPVWFETILQRHGVNSVFLCLNSAAGSELDTTLNLLDAMARAGTVKQVVYVSICGDYVSPTGIEELFRHCSAGHMLVKIPIESKLKYGGFPWRTTVLGPSLFFTNDLMSKPAMLDRGVYDAPVQRASRVSPADIALAARNVFFAADATKYAGQKIQIGSKHLFSGDEIAALWSAALGKRLRSWGSGEGEDLDRFEAEHQDVWAKAFGRDIRLMFECFEAMGFGMSEEEYKVQVELLGKEAEDYGSWVKGMGEKWRKEMK